MTHLPYILTSYSLAGAVVVWLAGSAWRRMNAARRRLAAIDPRGDRA